MADDTIRNIRISVSTETSQSQGNLTRVLETLKQIQSLVNEISFPSKKITALATSLGKLNNFKLSASFTKSIKTLKDGMREINDVITSPKKTEAAASWIGAIAEAAKAEAKKMEAATGKARLEYQKQQSLVRNAYNQDKLAQAQAKEARLSQPKVSGTSKSGYRVLSGEESKAARQAIMESRRYDAEMQARIAKHKAWSAQDAATQAKEAARQDKLVAKEIERQKKADEAFKRKDAATQARELARQEAKMYEQIALDRKRVAQEYERFANGGEVTARVLQLQELAFTKLKGAIVGAAVSLGKFIGKMAVSPFKRLASTIGDAVKRVGTFISSVKRIAVYRAIRFVLKEITQAFKEGIDNLYQYSKAINGTFASSMDTLATSALYAKNSLAAMVSPIINSLAPAVDFIVDKFVDFINVINELVATITGASTWTKALKYPKEYAEAVDGANGKAKELRATLLGFDEINRLDDNSKGSRGSAAELLDYSKMFEEKEVTNKTKGFIQAIKDAFKEGNFNDIGKTLGNKIKKGLDKINWDSIKDRVNKNASSVATLINGIISVPELADSIGKSIAEAFNTAIGKINTFFSTVNWKGVGDFLGNGLNTLVDKFDSNGLGRTLASIVNAGINAISGFVSSVKWSKIASFIADGINGFFNEVNIKELGRTISNVIVNAANGVATFLKETDFETIGKKIGELLKNLDWRRMFEGLANVIFNALGAVVEGIGGLIKESPIFGSLAAIAIANKIASFFGAPKVTSILGNGLVKLLAGGAEGAVASATTATTATAATAGSGILGALGSIALPVTLVAVAAGAAYMLAKYNAESGKLGQLEPYAGAIDDLANNPSRYYAKTLGIKESDLDFYDKVGAKKSGSTNSGTTLYDTSEDARKLGTINADLAQYAPNMYSLLKDVREDVLGIKNNTANNANYASSIKSKVDSIKASFTTMASNAMLVADPKTITAIKGYSNGGDPVTGSMFIAGERGAELVSSTSSGTSVYNRNQISASVASGNEQTVAALNELIAIGQALLDKDMSVTTDSISSSLNRSNLRAGRTVVVTGG